MTDMRAPTDWLNSYMRRFPHTGKVVDMLLEAKAIGKVEWPDWCLLPLAGWLEVVFYHKKQRGGLRLTLLPTPPTYHQSAPGAIPKVFIVLMTIFIKRWLTPSFQASYLATFCCDCLSRVFTSKHKSLRL